MAASTKPTSNDYISMGYIAGLSDQLRRLLFRFRRTRTLQQENAGQLVGIGIRATRSESGFIQVTEVYPDSPAAGGRHPGRVT